MHNIPRMKAVRDKRTGTRATGRNIVKNICTAARSCEKEMKRWYGRTRETEESLKRKAELISRYLGSHGRESSQIYIVRHVYPLMVREQRDCLCHNQDK